MRVSNQPTVTSVAPWIPLLGIFAGFAAAGMAFRGLSTQLTDFTNRAIGPAILAGVDPARRIVVYGVLCATFLVVAAAVIMALWLLNRVAAARTGYFLRPVERKAVAVLAIFGTIDLLLYVLMVSSVTQQAATFVAALLVFVLAVPVLRLLPPIAWLPGFTSALRIPALNGWALVMAYQSTMIWRVFCHAAPGSLPVFLVVMAIVWFLLLMLGALILGRASGGAARGRRMRIMLAAGLPVAFLPAMAPVANEIQYLLAMRGGSGVSPQALAAVLIALLIGLAVFLAWRARRITGPMLHVFSRGYFPSILITNGLLTLHAQTQTLQTLDLFHKGEATVPTLQWLRHGMIPLIEACPPHGLMDMLPQALLARLTGNLSLDMLAWGTGYMDGWLPGTVGVLLLYAVLARLLEPLTALFLILLAPVDLMFSQYFSPILLPALAVAAAVRGKSRHAIWMLSLAAVSVLLWRADFAVATVAGLGVVLTGWWWARALPRWRALAAGLCVTLGSLAALAAWLAHTQGVSLAHSLHQYAEYLSLQGAAAAYTVIHGDHGPLVVFQYLIIPAVGLVYMLDCFLRVYVRRQRLGDHRALLMFLAVAHLALFVRSLQRHCLFEQTFTLYFFFPLLAFLPYQLGWCSRRRILWIFLGMMACAAVLSPAGPHSSRSIRWPAAMTGYGGFAFNAWHRTDKRVLVQDTSVDDVVKFLRQELGSNQTYYDFGNAPLLYLLTEKPPPTYIIENVYHTSEPVQRDVVEALAAWHGAGNLPYVLFRQYGPWDQFDGVPNEIRSYRVAEFIYTHYEPCLIAGRFELWRDRRAAKNETAETLLGRYPKLVPVDSHRPQEMPLGQLPFLWANRDARQPAERAKVLQDIVTGPVHVLVDGNTEYFAVDAHLPREAGNYLHFRLAAPQPAMLTISYGAIDTTNTIQFSVQPSAEPQSYLVRVSAQWAWWRDSVSQLSVTASNDMTLAGLRVLEGD